MSKIVEELKSKIELIGESSSNIAILSDLMDGKANEVLGGIASKIKQSSKIGKTTKEKKELQKAETQKYIDNWSDVLDRLKKERKGKEKDIVLNKISSTINNLLNDINDISNAIETGKKLTIDPNKYTFKVSVGVAPAAGQMVTRGEVIKAGVMTEDQAIDSLKKGGKEWKEFLRSKDVSGDSKQSFISRLMADNRKNNFIFVNPTPKKSKLTGKPLNQIIANIEKLQKDKNFYGEGVERFEIEEAPKTIAEVKKALKGNIKVRDLTKASQAQKQLINGKSLARIRADLGSFFKMRTAEQILEDEDDDDEPEIGPRPGPKPAFTQLKPSPEGVKLPKNKKISEIIRNELSIYEGKLRMNMFRSQAYDNIKNNIRYKKGTPNEKNQLMINEINRLAKDPKNKYKEQVEELYKYMGKSLNIEKPTKANVIKKLLKEELAQAKVSDIEKVINDAAVNRNRLEELRNKPRGKLTKEEKDEFSKLFENINKMEEDAEVGEIILQTIKNGLSLANQYTKRHVTDVATPSERISAEREKEIEEAQKKGSLEVLPEEIKAKPVALPNINEELVKVKKEIAEAKKEKGKDKDIDHGKLEDLKEKERELENQLRGKRKDRPRPVAKPSEKQGIFRPYYPNVTQKNVDEAQILSNLDEQMLSLHNAEIFDIPSDNTGGLGTSDTNFLVKDNQETYNRTHEGSLDDFITWNNYAQNPSFWNGVPEINKESAMKEIKFDKFINDETVVMDFLELFNKEENGLQDQYQPPKETNVFRDQYMPPSNYYKPTPYSNFANTVNMGFLHTQFYDNVNFFLNP